MLSGPFVSLHRIKAAAGYRCSCHRHARKWNAFIVLEGSMTIAVEQTGYPLTDRTTLRAGEMTTVAPGLWHWFEAGRRGVVALELYYLEPLGEDIERRDHGTTIKRTRARRT